jgi:putative transposase
MCRVLKVNRTSFHAWERRPPSDRDLADAWLLERIHQIHRASNGTYGAPRVHAELRLGEGIRVGRKRVERLMARAGLQGIPVPRRKVTTIRVDGVGHVKDLVDRDFNADAPNRLWCADITYLPSWEGWLYLASVIDLYSRMIVGWCMAEHMRVELVVGALEMAVARRRPDPGEVVHHSDHGSQGGFNRSSQRSSEKWGCGEHAEAEIGQGGSGGDAVAGSSECGSARASAAVLDGDRARAHEPGRRGRGGRLGRGRRPVVPGGWRDANRHYGPVVGALPVVR